MDHEEGELGELHQAMRAGLQRRAEQADVALPVTDRVRPTGRRRGLAIGAVIGLVAASLVTVAVVESLTGPADDLVPSPAAPTSAASEVTDSATADPVPEVETRTEYFGGTQVEVPAEWGWGSSPVMCGETPVGEPYVGRPIPATDACGPAVFDAMPTAPYVWLGADVQLGSVDLGGGWTRETIEVEGTMVSVAAQDQSLRNQILGSATAQDLCLPALERAPEPTYESTVEGVGAFVDARLCAYRDVGAGLALVYAMDLDESVSESSFVEVGAAPRSDTRCGESREVVTVEAIHGDPYSPSPRLQLLSRLVYNLSCGTVRAQAPLQARETHRLTEATVRPWATGGALRHILVGTYDQWAYEYFIGIQG